MSEDLMWESSDDAEIAAERKAARRRCRTSFFCMSSSLPISAGVLLIPMGFGFRQDFMVKTGLWLLLLGAVILYFTTDAWFPAARYHAQNAIDSCAEGQPLACLDPLTGPPIFLFPMIGCIAFFVTLVLVGVVSSSSTISDDYDNWLYSMDIAIGVTGTISLVLLGLSYRGLKKLVS
jgi:hypothetical protein